MCVRECVCVCDKGIPVLSKKPTARARVSDPVYLNDNSYLYIYIYIYICI